MVLYVVDSTFSPKDDVLSLTRKECEALATNKSKQGAVRFDSIDEFIDAFNEGLVSDEYFILKFDN